MSGRLSGKVCDYRRLIAWTTSSKATGLERQSKPKTHIEWIFRFLPVKDRVGLAYA